MSTILHEGRPQSDALAPAVVLVPMLNLGLAADMLQLAAMLSRHEEPSETPGAAPGGDDGALQPLALPRTRIVVLSVVAVPSNQPLTTGMDMARSYRALLDFLPSEVEADGRRVRVDRIVKVARDVAGAIHQAAYDERADMVLLYWKGLSREGRRHTYGRIIDATLKNPPCSVMLARLEGWQQGRRVLLPVRGGPAAEQALYLSAPLAERLNLPLAVMHNVPRGPVPGGEETLVEALGEEPYIVFNEHLRRVQEWTTVPVESIITRRADPADALTGEARPDDILVMGLPEPPVRKPAEDDAASTGPAEPEDDPAVASSVVLRVSKEKGPPLLLLRTPAAIDLASYSRKVHARGSKKNWRDMPFEHWFVEHTYHSDEFKDVEEFLRAKRAEGVTLSVALLTSNDERHIHSIITGLQRVLVELNPVADQIVVVDAGSSDNTPEIARRHGAEVYEASTILPSEGALHGRGESWWKSLAVLKGDIVVWLDVRARRFHPSTALSLAGPLLRVPGLQLVKGFGLADAPDGHRERPQGGDDFSPVDMSWGGFVVPRRDQVGYPSQVRVQALKPADLDDLTAQQISMLPPRTLLQVLFPALAGVISPFSRDFAARKDSMMTVPAFAGNSLDLGLLLSVATQYGPNAIAQVELRNAQPAQPPAPGVRSALEALQVMALRLHDPKMRRHAHQLAERLHHELEGRRPGSEGDAEVVSRMFEVRALSPVERPAMKTVLHKP